MKKNKKLSICLVVAVIAILFVGYLFFMSPLTGKRTVRLQNVKYGELDTAINFFEGKYKNYSILKVESFTKLYSEMYLRLLSTNEFDNVYLDSKIEIVEGNYPKNINEIVLPYSMKTGMDFSKNLETNGYEIGSKIKINTAPYRIKVMPNINKNEFIDVELKYSTNCSNGGFNSNKPYVENDEYIYEEYTVVGFYWFTLLENDYTFFSGNEGMVDAITYLEQNTMENDDRLNVNVELKYNVYTKKKLNNITNEIHNKFNRYDESELSTMKTCNDSFEINFQSDEELRREIYGH